MMKEFNEMRAISHLCSPLHYILACRIFTSGGGVNRAPQNWGGGVREKGSIDKHH